MRLEILEGDGEGGVIEVPDRGHFVLGRHVACDLKLKGKGVSRRHALLSVDGDELAIQDLGSQNGTYVNSTRIEGETPLHDGDKVRVGSSVLLLVRTKPEKGPAREPTSRLRGATPPTRISARKRAVFDRTPGPVFCEVCEATIAPEDLRPRAGAVRLDDGSVVCPTCAPALSSRLLIGERYRLVRELGKGSVAVVWKAIDEHVRRIVAVKVLKERDVPPTALAYLERETEILRSLDHPAIARLLDAGEHDGGRFLVMEIVRGADLGTILENRGGVPAADAALLGFSIAGALAHAHRLGIVHRDVKPTNVLISPAGAVKLVDFGVAKWASGGGGRMTRRGSRRGTPAYMAPEQARDPASAGPRADVYGLGATLYHAVSGSPPFGRGTPPAQILEKLDRGESPISFPASVTSTALGLATVISRAMDHDPENRYPDGEAMRSALLECMDLSIAAGILP